MTPNPSASKELDLLSGQKEAQREELTGTLEGQVAQLAQETVAQFRQHLDALLEYRYTDIERQVREQIAVEVDRAVEEARRVERGILAGELNQAVRRLRSVSTTEDVTRWLLDATAAFCDRAAVLAVHGRFLQGLCVRGVESVDALHLFDTLDVPLEEAPAFGQAADGQDPVVAIATRGEISDAIHGVFGHRLGERVYLFPVVVRGETAAVLYVAPGSQSVDVAPLELVCQIAASVAETLVVEPPPAADAPASVPALVQIDGWKPITDWKVTPPDWPSLAPEEQELHLQARRFARVHVAEMRLYRGDEVQEGRGSRKLYLALKNEIDRARDAFRQKFLSASPTMVDYLHLELVRSLAHDKATLLGREYPGPLA